MRTNIILGNLLVEEWTEITVDHGIPTGVNKYYKIIKDTGLYYHVDGVLGGTFILIK